MTVTNDPYYYDDPDWVDPDEESTDTRRVHLEGGFTPRRRWICSECLGRTITNRCPIWITQLLCWVRFHDRRFHTDYSRVIARVEELLQEHADEEYGVNPVGLNAVRKAVFLAHDGHPKYQKCSRDATPTEAS